MYTFSRSLAEAQLITHLSLGRCILQEEWGAAAVIQGGEQLKRLPLLGTLQSVRKGMSDSIQEKVQQLLRQVHAP